MPRRIATNPRRVVQGPANPACRTIIGTSTIDSSWLIRSSSSPTCWHRPSPRSPVPTTRWIRWCGRATAPTRRPTVRCALAKQLGRKPREVAEDVVAAADLAGKAHGRGRRARVHQPHVRRRVPRRSSSTRCAADDRLGVRVGGDARAGRRRLLGAQHRQGDAHRAPAHDGHRRRARAPARVRRPHRHPREPRRRLGHAVRHAHRAPRRHRRDRGCRRAERRRPRRLLQAGPGEVRRQRGVPGSRPPAGRAAAERRSRDAAPVAAAGRSQHAALQPAVPQARRAADRRRPRRREHVQRPAARGRRAAAQRRACWRRATAPRSCSRRGTPTARASRCR